jgi:hypothetical protein
VVPYPKLDKEQGDKTANEGQFLVKTEMKKAPQGEGRARGRKRTKD